MTNALTTAQEATTPANSIEGFVTQYRHYARKTVENIILLGKTICDAEKFLSNKEISEFWTQIGSSPKDSTYRKLKEIGRMDYRLNEHLDILPNNWTTLYELAKIKDEDFTKLIEGKVLHKEVTSKEIKQALDGKEHVRVVKNTVFLTLKLEAKNSEMMFQMEQDLHKIAERYGVAVKIENIEIYERWKKINEQLEVAA